jgi:hypothetical protein
MKSDNALDQQAPAEIAARLMAPASESALWTHAQVRALLIRAVEEERYGSRAKHPEHSASDRR